MIKDIRWLGLVLGYPFNSLKITLTKHTPYWLKVLPGNLIISFPFVHKTRLLTQDFSQIRGNFWKFQVISEQKSLNNQHQNEWCISINIDVLIFNHMLCFCSLWFMFSPDGWLDFAFSRSASEVFVSEILSKL